MQSLDDVGENLMGLLSQAQGRSPRHAALTGSARDGNLKEEKFIDLPIDLL